MDITLVAHYFEMGYGVSRYSSSLYAELAKTENIQKLGCPHIFPSALKSAFDFLFFIPFKTLLLARNPIVHFTIHQSGFIIPVLKFFRKCRVVFTVHDLPHLLPGRNKLLLWPITKSIGIGARNADAVIANSQKTKEELVSELGVEEGKITVTPLGVDEKFKQQKSSHETFTVGYLGGFAGHKDVPFLLEAFSLAQKEIDCRLLLYGKGRDYARCVQLARELGLENYEFMGFADESELVKIYNSFDVFVFPSNSEGFGLPIIEAQKCGLPVIVKKNAIIPEEVVRYSLKAGTPREAAGMIADIKRNGYSQSEEQILYLEEFTWKRCAQKTLSLYKTLLKE